MGLSFLHYDALPPRSSASTKRSTQARLKDRLVMTPLVTVRGNYTVKAVIDRIIVHVETSRPTSRRDIKTAVDSVDAGSSCYVEDLGGCYRIQIQEPQPTALSQAVALIAKNWGIVGEARPFLVELSLDFHARRTHDAESRLRLREQMVGLLQRHYFFDPKYHTSTKADAHQVYKPEQTGPLKTDYLFSSPRNVGRRFPDRDVEHEHVRKRLARGFTVSNRLYLDSTLYMGDEFDGVLVRIQHKIGDNRNSAKGTLIRLDDRDRRARIEVQLSGFELLAKYGLATVSDLKTADFRAIRKAHLSFWLPTIETPSVDQPKAVRQLLERGLYGTEALRRLTDWEEKHSGPVGGAAAGGRRDRRGAGPTGRLVAWSELNDAVGDALDSLSHQWGRL